MTTPLLILKATGMNIDNVNMGESTNGDKLVIADWNKLDRKILRRIDTLFDDKGYTKAYEDEYIRCDICYKFAPCQPSSYGDLNLIQVIDGAAICPECCQANVDDYLKDKINNPNNANTVLTNDELLELGFTQIQNNLASGYHSGQNDKPEEIYKRYKGEYAELLFSIDSLGQFDTHFSVWGR
jgi:hypothetical protein